MYANITSKFFSNRFKMKDVFFEIRIPYTSTVFKLRLHITHKSFKQNPNIFGGERTPNLISAKQSTA